MLSKLLTIGSLLLATHPEALAAHPEIRTAQPDGLLQQPSRNETGSQDPGVLRRSARAKTAVRVINGRLVLRCDISTKYRRIPANLFIDLDNPCGFELHNKAASPLGAEEADGTPNPITVHLPNFNLVIPSREHGDEDYLDKFTKWYSEDLGENAVVGTLGSKVLRDYHLILDLESDMLEIGTPAEALDTPPEPGPGSITVPITVVNDLVWLPVLLPDGRPSSMGLGTSRFDSLIDEDYCDQVDRPAGDIGALRVQDIDLSEFIALRPAPVNYSHTDGAVGMLGLNFMQNYRVEIDRVNRFVKLERTRPIRFPAEDLCFFQALAEDEPEPMEAFLEQYPNVRLSYEAADVLLDLRMAYGADQEEFGRALRWVDQTRLEDLRATEALETMKKLERAGFPEAMLVAGELGVEAGRDDRYPNAVHEVHSKMGAIMLESGRDQDAWRHLLSAAFGLPEDGPINLNLGRFYERQGRYQRAFSRFVQAVIVPESGEQALIGMERVYPQLEDQEPLSIDLIDRLIAGKIESFGAATRFAPEEQRKNTRVVLAEFFTNAHSRGAIGGALGREGLISHFGREHLAVLAYHHFAPEMDPMAIQLGAEMNRLYGLQDGQAAHIFDGRRNGPAAARARFKEAVYNRCRELVLEELTRPSYHDIDIDARVQDGRLVGSVRVEGPTGFQHRLHVVLVEKGVLYPGKSKVVVHRMVARGALTPDASGVAYQPSGGSMELEFDHDLESFTSANQAYLQQLESEGKGLSSKLATRIDPRQVSIVAYLRDHMTLEILQAVQSDPQLPEDA